VVAHEVSTAVEECVAEAGAAAAARRLGILTGTDLPATMHDYISVHWARAKLSWRRLPLWVPACVVDIGAFTLDEANRRVQFLADGAPARAANRLPIRV